ncbi:unnamed protein product [Closterium sp. NIES-64]|nr:unnamed protein product [Closterium sp. NIES-64]
MREDELSVADRQMVGGAPAACPATQSGSGREEDGWREQKASSVSSELRPTSHQGGLQGGFPPHLRSLTSLQDLPCSARLVPSPCAFPIVGARYSCLDCPERAGFGLCAACYSCPPVLPRPAFPPSFSFPLSWFPLSSPRSLPLISSLATGLPHSGGVLQLSCLPGVGGL